MKLSNTNIKVSDVKSTLGVTDNRVSYLCGNAHKKINKWSYYKPIIYKKNSGLSESEYQGQYSEISKGIYCGLSMGTNYGRLKELLDFDFTYYPPKGGENEPYRLGDFRNYDTAATPTPTGSIYSPIRYNNNEQGITVEFQYNPNNTTIPNQCLLFFFGCVIYAQHTAYVTVKIANRKIQPGFGTFRVCLLLIIIKTSQIDQLIYNYFCPC